MAELQASSRAWRPPTGVLGELVALATRRAGLLASGPGDHAGHLSGPRRDLPRALRGAGVAVIAEVKRRSPSQGELDDAMPAASRAAAYAAGGAAAVSVLTEPSRFGGSIADLEAVRGAVDVPVLRKDFIVHPAQLGEARRAGADAVLLIARALAGGHAADLAAQAEAHGLAVLFEVRDEEELARGLAIPNAVIGVNARDLETLAIEPAVPERLIPLVPHDRIAVFESGVTSRADVERAARLGADAVLVGSLLSRQRDGSAAVAALTGVPRVSRG